MRMMGVLRSRFPPFIIRPLHGLSIIINNDNGNGSIKRRSEIEDE